ncbi:MAG: hypothetical protein ACOCVN_01730 [bacterium]
MKQSYTYSEYEIQNGILIGRFNVEVIDLEIAKQITKDRHNFAKGKEYPTLVDFRKVSSTTKEARDFFNGSVAAKNILCMAVLIDSEVGRIIASFFLKFNKPAYELKLFTKEEEALKWLEEKCMKRE